MKKNVIISIIGAGGTPMQQTEQLELITVGEMIKNGHAYTVSYDESIMTGMEGTKTTLNVNPEKITLTRSGTVNSQFVFQKGHNHISHYDVNEGSFTIGIFTEKMNVDMHEQGANIKVAYQMSIDNETYVENDFIMHVKEVNGEWKS